MNESPGVFYFMKKKLELIMSLCLLAAAFILAKQGAVLVQSEKAAREKIDVYKRQLYHRLPPQFYSMAHPQTTIKYPIKIIAEK